jgi:hypothetical protein
MRAVVATAAAVAFTLLALAPGPARAGTYDVVACDGAPGAANNSWWPWTPSARMRASSACPSNDAAEGGIWVSNIPGAGRVAYGEQAWQQFWAPEGARAVALTYTGGFWRAGPGVSDSSDWAAEIATEVGTVYGCGPYQAPECRLTSATPRTLALAPTGWVSIVASCFALDFCDGSVLPPRDGQYGQTTAAAQLRSATVRIADSTAPSMTIAGGDLSAGGWVRGTRTVGYRGADNVGIRIARAQVDGAERASATLPCDYTRAAPCPIAPSGTLTVDTTELADGRHELALGAVDAAANEGGSPAQTIQVDNTPPATSVTGAGNPEVPHPAAVTVRIAARDAASGMGEPGGAYVGWKLDDAPDWARAPGDEVDVRVGGDGEHTLRWYAVDAVGNRSAEATRTIVVGHRAAAPPLVTAGFSHRTSNPGTTFTAARRFGAPCPAVANLAADRAAAVAGDTLVGFPLPPAPDCTVASAVLRLYATTPPGDGRPIEVARASSAWDEATVTAATRPGTVGTAATATAPGQPGWVEWDATAQVQAIYRQGDNGLYVREGGLQGFCLRTCAVADHRPQLVVRFGE